MGNTTGIILCGGKYTRMGQNKALLELGNKRVIDHVIEELTKVCDEIIFSTNSNELDLFDGKKIPDEIKDVGPIAGFYSALKASRTQGNLIVSCDTPFISAKLLSYLKEKSIGYEVVLPVYKNQLQPMVGWFHKNMATVIEKQIEKGNRKPINIFENANINALKITKELGFYSEHLFFNINTKEDYEEAKRIYLGISC